MWSTKPQGTGGGDGSAGGGEGSDGGGEGLDDGGGDGDAEGGAQSYNSEPALHFSSSLL